MLYTQRRFAPAPLSEYRLVVPDRLPLFWNGERSGHHAALAIRCAAATEGFAMAEAVRPVAHVGASARVRGLVRNVRGSRRR